MTDDRQIDGWTDSYKLIGLMKDRNERHINRQTNEQTHKLTGLMKDICKTDWCDTQDKLTGSTI